MVVNDVVKPNHFNNIVDSLKERKRLVQDEVDKDMEEIKGINKAIKLLEGVK